MARLSSNTVRTVRFYEETGVLEPAHRSEGGHRLFPATELDKLVFISNMRDAGLSLEEIRLVLGVKAAGTCGAASSERLIGLLGEHVAAMTAKIDALSRLRAEFERAATLLGGCLTCTQDSLFPTGCGRCEKMQGGPATAPHGEAPHDGAAHDGAAHDGAAHGEAPHGESPPVAASGETPADLDSVIVPEARAVQAISEARAVQVISEIRAVQAVPEAQAAGGECGPDEGEESVATSGNLPLAVRVLWQLHPPGERSS
jgi:DNA-binding transcriptional MerR regulator